jgi:flagellar motor switch protein FliM
MMISVDDKLAGALLERQFGGAQSGSPRKASGPCRATASLARDIAGGVAHAIADAWPGGKLADVVASSDTAQFARADDNVATITLAFPDGEIRIALAIDGIARITGAPAQPRIADWTSQLRASAMSVRLPVRAILARPQFPAATVMRLSVGDVLPISKPTSVPLYAGAYRLATGILTETDGRTAVQIQMMESIPND